MQVPLPVIFAKVVHVVVEHANNFQEQQINDLVSYNEVINNELVVAKPEELT